MGRLDAITDMTGKMSSLDMNAQNIGNIIDELNRNSDQLDAIANTLNIIGKGTLSMNWDGSSGFVNTVSQTHGFTVPPLFMASFTRSDQPGIYYPVPMWFYDGAGNFQQRIYGYTDSSKIFFQLATASAGATLTYTFSWYIIQQPAQVPTGS